MRMSHDLTSPEKAHNERGSHVNKSEQQEAPPLVHVGGAYFSILPTGKRKKQINKNRNTCISRIEIHYVM